MNGSAPLDTHGKVTSALKRIAKAEGLSPNEIYNRFFREVFLGELMKRDPAWVLKGGTNLCCLIPNARHTQDLDLYRQHAPRGHLHAADALVQSMHRLVIGPYTFRVEKPRTNKPRGAIDNIQLVTHVDFGVSPFTRFNIDVSGDITAPVVTSTLRMQRSDGINVAFLDSEIEIRSYPVENQVADKVCAMYETHEGRASTRYRDLYDIGSIALHLQVDAYTLHKAITEQKVLRSLTLPPRVQLPSSEWPQGYARFVKTVSTRSLQLATVDKALRVAARLLDPILTPSAPLVHGCWMPSDQAWDENPASLI